MHRHGRLVVVGRGPRLRHRQDRFAHRLSGGLGHGRHPRLSRDLDPEDQVSISLTKFHTGHVQKS